MAVLCQAVIAEPAEFHSSASRVAKIPCSSLLGPVGTSTSFQVDVVFEVLVAILFLAILYCAASESFA